MRVSTAGFAAMAARLRALADEVCEGRMVLSLEGGYDLEALGESVRAVSEVLSDDQAAVGAPPKPGPLTNPLVERLREGHAALWHSLKGA
jgi:acetoin utilization deacetylase AcuC-like enzyme